MNCPGISILRLGAIVGLGVLFAACGEDPKPSTPRDVLMHVYKYDETVRFGAGGDSHRFKAAGWSHAEDSFSWTDGHRATLLMQVSPSRSRRQLQMRMSGHTKSDDLPFQPVDVFVNGEKLASWKVGPELATYEAIIPKRMVNAGGLLTIDLDIPRAISPIALGGPPDPRQLGLKCVEMRLVKASGAAAK
jgi:hypothetical protein